jgi:glucose-6-phosphate 1-dehydrogenase
VGVGRRPLREDELAEHTREAIFAAVPDADEQVVSELLSRLRYVGGDAEGDSVHERLRAALAGTEAPVFYVATPPSMFLSVAEELAEAGLADGARLVVEKPFGTDLETARELNAGLTAIFPEERLFRIDHFLGKEPVQDIMYLRFANALFEPVWSREDVDSIQITMAEDFGVAGRGGFYEGVGALRDVVQNHLLQVLALAAMEPPSGGADAIPRRRLDVFQAMPPADPARAVRGQYDGYRDVDGVAPDSDTETFVALRLTVDNWRWAGVPFYIRAGKELPVEVTEVRVIFQQPPPLGIGGRVNPDPDELILRIKPEPGAELCLMAKQAGADALHRVHLDMLFESQVGDQPEPYERLLRDALRGDPQLFPTQEAIEETWRIVQPLLDDPPPVMPYEIGSWGPEEADRLVKGVCEWDQPWRPVEDARQHVLLGG